MSLERKRSLAWVNVGTGWQTAPVVDTLDNGTRVRVELEDGTQTVVSNWHAHDPSHEQDLDDAGQMSDLNEAALLKLLARRFASDKIYTWTGDILLSVNPYREVPGLYEDHTQPPGGWTAHSGARAHIFAVAELAFSKVAAGVKSQVLIVNGESGAGKTEACRLLLEQIASSSADARQLSERPSEPSSLPAVAETPDGDWLPCADGGFVRYRRGSQAARSRHVSRVSHATPPSGRSSAISFGARVTPLAASSPTPTELRRSRSSLEASTDADFLT